MRRLLVLLLTSLALGGGPKIVFDKTQVDFGPVIEGELRRHVFTFTNQGDAELVIQRVVAKCECTAALLSLSTIAPGDTGRVAVEFNSLGRQGKFRTAVQIVSNDGSQKDGGPNSTQLVLAADIISLVRLNPRAAYYPALDFGTRDTRRIVLTPLEKPDFEILGIRSLVPWIEGSAKRVEEGGVAGYEVTVAITENAPIGKLRENLVILTNDPRQPEVYINVLANVRGDVICNPEILQFFEIERGALVQSLQVIRDRGKPLDILAVRISSPYLTAEAHELVDGRFWDVVFSLAPDTPAGAGQATVTIELDDPAQPVFTVPAIWNLDRRIRCQPSGAYFDKAAPQPLEVIVYLPHAYQGALSAEVPDWLTASISVLDDARRRVTLTPKGAPQPGVVTLVTELPGESRVELPIVLGGAE